MPTYNRSNILRTTLALGTLELKPRGMICNKLRSWKVCETPARAGELKNKAEHPLGSPCQRLCPKYQTDELPRFHVQGLHHKCGSGKEPPRVTFVHDSAWKTDDAAATPQGSAPEASTVISASVALHDQQPKVPNDAK